MGLFDLLTGSSSSSKRSPTSKPLDKVFKTYKGLHDTLLKIHSLDPKQRALVEELLKKYLSGGGVSRWEVRNKILPTLSKLRREGQLSATDYYNLKKILAD